MNVWANIIKGIITTDNRDKQRKKHYTQMTREEKKLIRDRLKAILPYIRCSSHIAERDDFCGIQLIKEMIINDTYDIIEYNVSKSGRNNDFIGKRAVIRSRKYFNRNVSIKGGERRLQECNICVVLDINTGTIVTTYWNLANDNHSSVNMSRYDDSLKIEL